jgi:hypothetical protein
MLQNDKSIMKQLSLPLLFVSLFLFTACHDDIEDRLDAIEKALATEPTFLTFSTKDEDNEDVVINAEFKYKPTGWGNLLVNNKNGTYTIILERYSDVEASEGVSMRFIYNPETKEISESHLGLWCIARYHGELWFNIYDYQNMTDFNIDMRNFNKETGLVDFTLKATTDSNYENNIFQNKAMNCEVKVKGKLRLTENLNMY